MKRRIAVAGLALTACAPVREIRDRIYGKPKKKPEKKTNETPPAPFPAYLLEAFPDARSVRIDPGSPRISLAAEAILTRNDPHRRRGPPRFSPDGRLLAYEETESSGEARWIVIRKLDGTLIRRITLSPRPRERMDGHAWSAAALSWAPSSDGFAYTRETPLGAFEAVVTDLAGDARRLTGPPALDGAIAWSPAGDRIAWIAATRVGEIWSADAATRKGDRVLSTGKRIDSFGFSEDGKRVVCSIGAAPERDIITAEVPDGAVKRLTEWPFDDHEPAFSPDGKRVAFWSSFRPIDAGPGRSLVVVAADGSDPKSGAVLMERVIASKVSTQASGPPAWSPDSKWIATVEPRTEDYRALVLLEVGSSERHELSADSITNEDPTVSTDGVIAWRARQEWGDHVVIGLTARGAMRTEK